MRTAEKTRREVFTRTLLPHVLRAFFVLAVCILSLFVHEAASFAQAPPPPPPPRGRPEPPRLDADAVADHLQKVRGQLAHVRTSSGDVDKLLAAARRALASADRKLKSRDIPSADRMVAAADAFVRAAEHTSHVAEGPKGPVPPAREIADHLQRVYFRLEQADFFAGRSTDVDAKALPTIARNYYEQARKAYDEGSWFAADEYAKSADDTVRGLENLAQAAAPEPPRPPGPG